VKQFFFRPEERHRWAALVLPGLQGDLHWVPLSTVSQAIHLQRRTPTNPRKTKKEQNDALHHTRQPLQLRGSCNRKEFNPHAARLTALRHQ
jgi:hypothetical protein